MFGYHDGKLTPVETVSMTAPGFKGKVGGGAIHLSPDGRFLYVSNRGDANDLVIYAVNHTDGRLKHVGRQSSLGKTPREFLIDPTGKWLIVGNQDSDTFYVFSRNLETGQLGPNPQKVAVGKPVDFAGAGAVNEKGAADAAPFVLCAQHGRIPAGASPAIS